MGRRRRVGGGERPLFDAGVPDEGREKRLAGARQFAGRATRTGSRPRRRSPCAAAV